MSNNKEEYTLFYWPKIPGRGEFVRLCFELASVPFDQVNEVPQLVKLISNKSGLHIAAPHFAVPVLGIRSGDRMHYISQTPVILTFLAPRLGLLGDAEKLQGLERDVAVAQIHQLCATALDLNNETHDTHHPVSVSSYYEDQIQESKRRAADFKQNRLPKFLGLFQVALSKDGAGADKKSAAKRRLWGSKTTVADLTVFQVVDGLLFAFPKCMNKLRQRGEYKCVFDLHQDIKGELKSYLDSDRRKTYFQWCFQALSRTR
ncbi:uncharacterized protein MEPE_00446 [Melanopsichium pennsylvanicum]|uniref:GST N-terminal domain-containing protein n=1 Tax=Melanopsichium pennsylvanicum TaxID=63383 RepID=A0AAJ4XGP6_9BASI|nr:uncharacterized protein MEPE_00446 [Melanopsichium pennsylvanicum]